MTQPRPSKANPWEPDVAMSADHAARLIAAEFPELVPVHLELLGIGWDNTAYLVNENWVFRFPRRQIARDLIEIEARWLPVLAPCLPLPIPVPEYLGKPDETYPYPFCGYRLLAGRTACSGRFTLDDHMANADILAAFLSRLHSPDTAPKWLGSAPGDVIARTDLGRRTRVIMERLARLESRVPWVRDRGDAIRSLAQELSGARPRSGRGAWVHGDLYARHLLVDAENRVCGVIDWGDMHRGDIALDLSIAFSFLAPEARVRFCVAYGPVDLCEDPDLWQRARFQGLFYGVVLMDYGTETGDSALALVGENALTHALSGE